MCKKSNGFFLLCFRPSFCPTNWPSSIKISQNAMIKISARSPMVFGRDVFDLVFAQPNGAQNNHPTHITQNAPIKISARSPIFKKIMALVYAACTSSSRELPKTRGRKCARSPIFRKIMALVYAACTFFIPGAAHETWHFIGNKFLKLFRVDFSS